MAVLDGNLCDYNLCRVVFVDTSDDYRLMETPLPSDFYPVLKEIWVPRYSLLTQIRNSQVGGYLYDWHEEPTPERSCWTVGMVESSLKNELCSLHGELIG